MDTFLNGQPRKPQAGGVLMPTSAADTETKTKEYIEACLA